MTHEEKGRDATARCETQISNRGPDISAKTIWWKRHTQRYRRQYQQKRQALV